MSTNQENSPPMPASPVVEPSAAATPAPAPSTASPSAASESSPVPVVAAPSRMGAVWLGLLALLVAVAAGVAAYVLSQRLEDARQELARRNDEVATQVNDAKNTAGESDALAKELQARLQVAEIKLSEVSLQRSQLEELMLSLSRSRDDNLVQDLESSIRLAQQQAQLTGSVQPLVSALQSADQRIARAAQPRLNPVQRAIARDIDRVQVAALADIPALVTQLDDMARAVDEWPVRNEVGPLSTTKPTKPSDLPGRVSLNGNSAPKQAEPSAATASAAGTDAASTSGPASASATAASTAPSADSTAEPPAPAGTLDLPETEVAQSWFESLQSLWSRLWTGMTQKGSELVRVSRLDHPEAALLAPEQAFFLRENTKLRLLNARLGLLARQFGSVKADLESVQSQLDRFYDEKAPGVAQARELIVKLQDEVKTSEMPRPEETLAALATAAGGR